MNAPPPYAPPEQAPGAVLSLVLGIVGVVVCPLCGPFAWMYGKRAEAAVDASGGTLAGRGVATAGKILGIIGTALIALIALFFIGGMLLTIAVDGGGGTSEF